MSDGAEQTEPDILRYVETILPHDYLYELAVYLQTCAQIEFYGSSVICKTEGLQHGTKEWLDRHNELRRMPTKELITELSKAAHKFGHDPRLSNYLKKQAGWLHRFVDNRHIAVHGKHFVHGEAVVIDAPPKGGRDHQQNIVTPELAREATLDADRILKALVRISGDI